MCRDYMYVQRLYACAEAVLQRLQETQETWVQPLSWEDPLGGGNDNPLQYSCLENLMDRGAWWATFHGVAKVGHDLVTKPHHHPTNTAFFSYFHLCIFIYKYIQELM